MRLVISSLALIALLACEKKVEEVVPDALDAEVVETAPVATTEPVVDASAVVVPAVPATPVETAATACPPSCFTNGTMDDGKSTAGGTVSK